MVLLSASVCGLRRLVAMCAAYAASHGLVYNVKKSVVMVFEDGSRRWSNMPSVSINNCVLQRVCALYEVGKDYSFQSRESTTFYTCSLWNTYTLRAYNALRVQFNNAFRMLLGLPRYCSASGMFAEARVDCFYATMRKRCASLVRRVRGSTNSILAMIASRLDCLYVRHCCAISNGMEQR
ncbi:uncharacterized protein LOC121728202 [Aricia agestis]|uniref:uncharacterized protein LOC121728202 n=1 Tax=Aricia agestis TaxID=91739 RepID=UPI001C205D80|nr:uncharacterized protein LOC121728202 [Aricia agestis]